MDRVAAVFSDGLLSFEEPQSSAMRESLDRAGRAGTFQRVGEYRVEDVTSAPDTSPQCIRERNRKVDTGGSAAEAVTSMEPSDSGRV